MSYGMHHYLMEKAAQQEGMRKEAGAITEVFKKGLGWLGGKATAAGKAVWNQGDSLAAKLRGGELDDYGRAIVRGSGADVNGRADRLGAWLWENPKKTRAAILGLEGAGLVSAGTGAYAGGKALADKYHSDSSPAPEPSYLDKALELLNQYKGTAAGVSTGIPTAIAAAAMSKPGSRLKNALLYGAIASIIGGGTGYAYDKYNA